MVEHVAGDSQTETALQPDAEFMPRQRLESLQRTLLAQAVTRATGSVFYRERLRGLRGVIDSLPVERFQEHVPLLTKAELRQAGMVAWVTGTHEHIALLLATSGTTGSRIPLPYTRRDLYRWHQLAARTLFANGIRPTDVVLLPVPVTLYSGGHGMLGGLMQLGCTVVPIGAAQTPVVADILQSALGRPPSAIVTLPSHMLRLLESLPAAGYDPGGSPLRVGSFGAEPWTEASRHRIEDGFKLRAYDSYGIGELCGPGVAAECEQRDGMHVWEDAFFVEIVDPATGQPLPDGKPGELVLTSLFREVLPILRFRTGDASMIIPEECPCGRTHRRIARIARRLDDMLIITGVNIDPIDIERLLYAFPWLGNEFYLEAGGANRDALVVHVERHAGVGAPDNANVLIAESIRRYFPVRTVVNLYAAGGLERLPGKVQRIRG